MRERGQNFRIADAVRAGLARYADFSLAWNDDGYVGRVTVRGRWKYQAFADAPDDQLVAAMLAWCIEMGAPAAHATNPRTS